MPPGPYVHREKDEWETTEEKAYTVVKITVHARPIIATTFHFFRFCG